MASDAPLAPDFIRFLFSTKSKFDCYFEVGNKNQGKAERIGAVKLMLMAHSEVFRLELEDSDLKEKGDVPVKDVHPDTFKGMLKYVYGHNTTSDLCFDEADNMLYVAEKYMIKTLKDRLAVRLMKLLNPDNICSLLNNPACYTHLELDKAITKILRYNTDHVLASGVVDHIHLRHLPGNMVYDIVHHRTARRVQRSPLWLRTLYLHVQIYRRTELVNQRDLWKVAGALRRVGADCRATTVKLTPSNEDFWMPPTHLEDDLPFKSIVMQDLKRLLRLGQRVTVTIQCSAVQWMNADGFLKILEQYGLVVPEIELWRAAVKWAKHRADSEDGQLLRQQLTDSGLSRHLRLCTLTGDEICGEVVTTDVLTTDEIGTVCKSIGWKQKPEGLTEISNEIVSRKILQREKQVQDELSLTNLKPWGFSSSREYNMTLLTRKNTIELLPLVCQSSNRSNTDPENQTYKVNCTTTITEVVNLNNTESSLSNKWPITVTFSENVKCGVEFEIPLAVDGRNIILLPDTVYTVKMELTGVHKVYYGSCSGRYVNDHLTLAMPPPTGDHHFPFTKMQYRVTTVE